VKTSISPTKIAGNPRPEQTGRANDTGDILRGLPAGIKKKLRNLPRR
jgi:hypothetical protein